MSKTSVIKGGGASFVAAEQRHQRPINVLPVHEEHGLVDYERGRLYTRYSFLVDGRNMETMNEQLPIPHIHLRVFDRIEPEVPFQSRTSIDLGTTCVDSQTNRLYQNIQNIIETRKAIADLGIRILTEHSTGGLTDDSCGALIQHLPQFHIYDTSRMESITTIPRYWRTDWRPKEEQEQLPIEFFPYGADEINNFIEQAKLAEED